MGLELGLGVGLELELGLGLGLELVLELELELDLGSSRCGEPARAARARAALQLARLSLSPLIGGSCSSSDSSSCTCMDSAWSRPLGILDRNLDRNLDCNLDDLAQSRVHRVRVCTCAHDKPYTKTDLEQTCTCVRSCGAASTNSSLSIELRRYLPPPPPPPPREGERG